MHPGRVSRSRGLLATARIGRHDPAAALATSLATGLAASLLLAGCGGGDPSPGSSSSVSSGPGSSGAASSAPATSGPSGSGAAKGPLDPLAGASVPPVVRAGRTPTTRLSAPPAVINGAGTGSLRYSDAVALRITGIRQGQVTGQGPGVIRGPRTTFAVTLRNGSGATLDLDAVVVTLVYGRPGRIARPVYGDGTRDFAGPVRPGATASASYSFAVPAPGRSAVSVHVDFDAVHAAAVFAGPVS